MMSSVTIGKWRVSSGIGDICSGTWTAGPTTITEKFDLKNPEGEFVTHSIFSEANTHPDLIVIQKSTPSPRDTFCPGILITLKTDLAFIGAGERLLCYDLKEKKRLCEDTAALGFLQWKQFNDTVILSAELEMAAWDSTGKKLWRAYVEPPWHYIVDGETVTLDVMGEIEKFNIRTGSVKNRNILFS